MTIKMIVISFARLYVAYIKAFYISLFRKACNIFVFD